MHVESTNYDSSNRRIIALTRASDGTLQVNGRVAVTTRVVGGRIGLIVDGGTQYLVALAAFVQASRGEVPFENQREEEE